LRQFSQDLKVKRDTLVPKRMVLSVA